MIISNSIRKAVFPLTATMILSLGLTFQAFADDENMPSTDTSPNPVLTDDRPPIVEPGSDDTSPCPIGDYWCAEPTRTWYPVWTEKGWDYQPRTPEEEKALSQAASEDESLAQLKSDDFNPSSSKFIKQTMSPQEASYFCGPAAVQAALRNEGKYYSQAQISKWLDTNANGTGWSNVTASNPVARVMNQYSRFSFTAYSTPQGQGNQSAHVQALIIRNVQDINADNPVLSNIWKGAGFQGINGMPQGATVFHWLELYGYMQYGQAISFADPAGESPHVSWGNKALPYSYTGASILSVRQGGRGYVA